MRAAVRTGTILACLAFVGAVAWGANALIQQGDKYIPLAAALVSGGATLMGVGIGALVLRFNYRNQSLPIRLEFYKRKVDATDELYQASFQLLEKMERLHPKLELVVERKLVLNKDKWRTHLRDVATAMFAVEALQRVVTLATEFELIKAHDMYLEAGAKVINWAADADDPVAGRDNLLPMMTTMREKLGIFAAACAFTSGGIELSAGLAESIGFDRPRFTSELNKLLEEEPGVKL